MPFGNEQRRSRGHFLLPVLAVALVNRWWALSLAFVPCAVLFYLHEATDYVYPFHEDPYPTLVIVGTGFLLVIYSLGFLLRAALDLMVSAKWAQSLRNKDHEGRKPANYDVKSRDDQKVTAEGAAMT